MNHVSVSVVVPVYQGEESLIPLIDNLSLYFEPSITKAGYKFFIAEVLLVHDCGPDRSDLIINNLSNTYTQIKPIWLTRNFGQHAATLAGLSSATGDWLVTLDEDGQHSPKDIPTLLDVAVRDDLQIVYARPHGRAPHSLMRNLTSSLAKRVAQGLIGVNNAVYFQSFRFIRGDIGRTLAAYCGNGIFLDVGLQWIAERIGYCEVSMSQKSERKSGYTYAKLLRHFWALLLTSGTRPLRLVTLLGLFSMTLGIFIGIFALYERLVGNVTIEGWTSLIIAITFFSGFNLLALGIIAEYLSVTLGIAMGKPLYVISSRSSRQSR